MHTLWLPNTWLPMGTRNKNKGGESFQVCPLVLPLPKRSLSYRKAYGCTQYLCFQEKLYAVSAHGKAEETFPPEAKISSRESDRILVDLAPRFLV